MNNLAIVRFLRGEYLDAAQVQRDVVAAALAADPTLSTADAITQVHNLGVMLSRTDNLAEAEQHLQRALVARRRVLGTDHVVVGISLRWLSELRRLQQRPAEAESLAREALRALSPSYPPDHPRIAEATLSLGAALVEQRRISEAVPLLREALDIRRATLPLDGIPVAEARVWLGTALLRGGEAGAGRAQLDSALVTYRAAGRLNEIEARAATRALGRP
jgi:serine/threonine-protein kinase